MAEHRGSARHRQADRDVRQVHGGEERHALVSRTNTVNALIGPSGCGKSTFLRTLNRMHELSDGGWITGRVLLDGQDVYGPGVSPMQLRRRVGMVFQKPTPFPTMSIYDNVAAGLRLQRRRAPGEAGREWWSAR